VSGGLHKCRPIGRRAELGAGTVLAAGVALLLCLLLAAVAMAVQAGAASSRAAKTADLAALAAADAARGLVGGELCLRAAEATHKHGAFLAECRRIGPSGHIVDVDVAVPLRLVGWLDSPWREAKGLSRAGPPPGPGP
jgi:secretion/DNA translocation related TadE-like protein